MKFERPRGTRDFTPEEMFYREYVESTVIKAFKSYGYQPVLTPTFEHAELFQLKSGEEIIQHMYTFEDKGGRILCLRPEGTASVVRMFASELRTRPRPVKVYYVSPMFRYEEPQKGRYREFWQLGVELIGVATPESDAEVIALAAECLNKLGLKYTLRVSDIRVIRSILEDCGLTEPEQDEVIHLLDKGGVDEVKKIVKDKVFFDILGQKGGVGVVDAVDRLAKGRVSEITDGLKKTLRLLDAAGVEYIVDFSMARGLDYYTGMVFDVIVEGLGAQNQVCGGGRYDNLVKLFGGPDTPAVGFAFGFDRIVDALRLQGIGVQSPGVDVYVIAAGSEVREKAFTITLNLRRNLGGRVVLLGLAEKKLSKELEQASNLNARYAVIVGSRELSEDSVMVKDLSTGTQRKVRVGGLADILSAADDEVKP
jgi:histidyl-tRNA synthetase